MKRFSRPTKSLDSVHEGVLGTRLSLHLRGGRTAPLQQAERILLAEIDRIESIFSVYRADSELNRWKASSAGERGSLSDELGVLLRLGSDWHERSHGIFNPSVGALSERWRLAGELQIAPSEADVLDIVERIGDLPYRIESGRAVPRGDCSWLNFNALAKGLLIDIATASTISQSSLSSVVVNIGGDLVHQGDGFASVRVEDPFRPYDNADPLDTVLVSNQGVATSGSSKRGVRVGDTWFSHVIDPRTGWPVDLVRSATVVAPDAATADAVATVLSVLPPSEGLGFVESLTGDIACAIVAADRSMVTNGTWDALRRR